MFDDCIVNGCVISVQFCCGGNIFCYYASPEICLYKSKTLD